MIPFVQKSLEEIRKEEASLREKELQLEQVVALNKSLMLTVTELYEENLAFRELNRNVMLVVTELNETIYSAEEVGETK